jgi:hypothetical protein
VVTRVEPKSRLVTHGAEGSHWLAGGLPIASQSAISTPKYRSAYHGSG